MPDIPCPTNLTVIDNLLYTHNLSDVIHCILILPQRGGIHDKLFAVEYEFLHTLIEMLRVFDTYVEKYMCCIYDLVHKTPHSVEVVATFFDSLH